MIRIGTTLYKFDVNRRVYTRPRPAHLFGDVIYAEHFRPLEVIGETRVSWLMEHGFKARKQDPRESGFYTAEQMADEIWRHEHGTKIRRLVENATADQLRRIAEIMSYREE